jgi:hypothetical protein
MRELTVPARALGLKTGARRATSACAKSEVAK